MRASAFRLCTALLAWAALVLVAACATGGAPDAVPASPAPAVRLGPVLMLLDVPPRADKVRAVTAPDGRVHVLVASLSTRVVSEIVVSDDGAPQRRTVLAGAAPARLDAAFDRQGRLHVIADLDHLVFEKGAWRPSPETPWQGLAFSPLDVRFVPGAPDLVWLLSVRGSDIGASGRWALYGIGGYGAAIIWPWFTRGTRAVAVSATPAGLGPWVVVDPEGPLDTVVLDATADASGNVFLTYRASREDLLASATSSYVRIASDTLTGASGIPFSRAGTHAETRQLRAVKGSAMTEVGVVRGESRYRTNVVPLPPHHFGAAVGGALRVTASVTAQPRALVVAAPHDAWSGRGFPIQYLEFNDVAWSAPVDVGLADRAGSVLGGAIWDAFDIVVTPADRAFAVWPTTEGIVGRWIDRATSP